MSNSTPVHNWTVVVGNVGTVFDNTNGYAALRDFWAWRNASKSGYGRAAGEPVTLMKNGEPYKEHEPEDVAA